MSGGGWNFLGCGGMRYGGAWTCLSGASCPYSPMPFAALRSPRCSAPQTQGKAPGVLGVSLVMFPLLWYNRFQEKEVLTYVS